MLNCYIDQTGGRRSGPPPELFNLGEFLESDVQGSIDSCDFFLSKIEEIEQGKQETFDGNGNAWVVLIEAGYVTLECLWDDDLPLLKLGISEFREALLEWRAFIIETSSTTEASTKS